MNSSDGGFGGGREIEVIPDEPAPELLATVDSGRPPWLPPWLRWRRPSVLVAGALALVLIGGLIVGGGLYVSVAPVALAEMPAQTTLYYRDGTVLARLGGLDRRPVVYGDLVDGPVPAAAVAAQDPDFWTGRGGAISRSVVRMSLGFEPRGRRERAEVGIQAWKLDGTYPKEEILEYFLNSVAFGRRTYGIEAAAQAYFGKTVRKSAPPEEQLTTAEAIGLLAMVDQPEPSPDDPEGSPGFDPTRSVRARDNSQRRWTEIRDAMVAAGALSRADADDLAYPTNWQVFAPAPRAVPSNLVINHVLSELNQTAGSPFEGRAWGLVANGGYEIVTTLDPRAQAVLEKVVDPTTQASIMFGQPAALTAAAVAVEPGTGRVLAYYGGPDGNGMDHAGWYVDEKGEAAGFGFHPPGGSFLVHTLAAALKSGISLRSYWQYTSHAQPGRPSQNPIRNAGVCPSDQVRGASCSLLGSTVASLNVPFYDVTVSVAPSKVLEMARDAGIDAVWNDARERQNLAGTPDLSHLVPSQFDIVLGLGQYPVTVLDQANSMATYAAAGLRARAHFVAQVRQGDKVLYAETLPAPQQARVLNAGAAADLSWALSQSGRQLGVDVALKTGTWEYNNRTDQNAHAWAVGYASALAFAVWVGNQSEEAPLIDRSGATVWGSGLPSQIFRDFMTEAYQALQLPPQLFPAPVFGGRADPPGSTSG